MSFLRDALTEILMRGFARQSVVQVGQIIVYFIAVDMFNDSGQEVADQEKFQPLSL
jgi:hypothetical protein